MLDYLKPKQTSLPKINIPTVPKTVGTNIKNFANSNIGKIPTPNIGGNINKLTSTILTSDSNRILHSLKQDNIKTAESPQGKSLLGKAGDFMHNYGGAIMGATSAFDKQSTNLLTTGLEGAKDTLFSSLGPWGAVAGIADNIIGAVGGKTDTSEGLGGADTLNALSSALLPGAGFFTKKTDLYKIGEDFMGTSGYSGALKNATTAQANAGKKLLFGRRKLNKLRELAIRNEDVVTKAINESRDLRSSNFGSQSQQAANFNNTGGYRQRAIQFGRNGAKFNRSIIAGGKLHARKHNLNEIDHQLAGNITSKGTAVVMYEEGGKVTQVSEYEIGELVLRLDITDIIEDLKDDGSDESAIVAGKIIADELLNNTKDYSEEYEIED